MIDILALLEAKTRGNLTAEERQLLEQILYELRLRFVEASKPQSRIITPVSADRMLRGTVTLLGTGTSHGVPMIGCDARRAVDRSARSSACDPRSTSTCPNGAHPCRHDSRLPAAGAEHGLTRVDAVLFTHAHADHILGLDDLRRFNTLQGGADSVLREPRGVGGDPAAVLLCVRGHAAGRRRCSAARRPRNRAVRSPSAEFESCPSRYGTASCRSSASVSALSRT